MDHRMNETGRSMVEIIGVLAIIGVLSIGGIQGYSMAMSRYKITKALDQVQTMVTNIRSYYEGQGKFSVLSNEQAYSLGLLNDETWNGTDTENPFGGKINFGLGIAPRSFTIEYMGLTPEACVKFATADWGADSSSGLVAIYVGQGLTAKKFQWSNKTLPVDLVDAVDACTIHPTVRFEFK